MQMHQHLATNFQEIKTRMRNHRWNRPVTISNIRIRRTQQKKLNQNNGKPVMTMHECK